jgi:hypothetical protein
VAKKGREDQIDPKIVESLQNGLLSKTAFGKGIEKGYLAGKNGVEQNGRGYKGKKGHKKGHWGKKHRKGHKHGHHVRKGKKGRKGNGGML